MERLMKLSRLKSANPDFAPDQCRPEDYAEFYEGQDGDDEESCQACGRLLSATYGRPILTYTVAGATPDGINNLGEIGEPRFVHVCSAACAEFLEWCKKNN